MRQVNSTHWEHMFALYRKKIKKSSNVRKNVLVEWERRTVPKTERFWEEGLNIVRLINGTDHKLWERKFAKRERGEKKRKKLRKGVDN